MPRRGIHHVVMIYFRGPHGETVVVLRRDYEVTHAGLFRGANPFVGVEIGRIKNTRDIGAVFGDGNLKNPLDVFGVTATLASLVFVTQGRIDAPMHEHPKSRIAPPGDAFVM